MSKKYKITVLEFDGEGESLKAAALYEQTIPSIDLRAVIEAVNKKPRLQFIQAEPPPRKRAPRSDRGQKRLKLGAAEDLPTSA